ncbi:response regulator, partial [Nocardioides sp. CER28]
MIRVLVVDDSALIRRLISTALSEAADIEIVGTARDGLEAVDRVDELQPDVVTLDIEMPRLDGLGALQRIREKHRRLPVIMFSTLTERGAAATLEALSRGASDYVTKPSNTGSVAEGLASVRDQLVPRIRALAGRSTLVPSAAPV